MDRRPSSRIAGFYQRSLADRVAHVTGLGDGALLSAASRAWLEQGGGLSVDTADRMSENVVGTVGLPLGLGLNVRVGQRDYLVPMAVEEPSVVAAASNAARLVRLGAQLCDKDRNVINRDYERAWLPSAVQPGATTELPVKLTAPDKPGRYALKLDLVCEGIDGFEACGSQTTVKTLLVI